MGVEKHSAAGGCVRYTVPVKLFVLFYSYCLRYRIAVVCTSPLKPPTYFITIGWAELNETNAIIKDTRETKFEPTLYSERSKEVVKSVISFKNSIFKVANVYCLK